MQLKIAGLSQFSFLGLLCYFVLVEYFFSLHSINVQRAQLQYPLHTHPPLCASALGIKLPLSVAAAVTLWDNIFIPVDIMYAHMIKMYIPCTLNIHLNISLKFISPWKVN